MDNVEHLSEVQRGERAGEDLHPVEQPRPALSLLQLRDEEHVREILEKYASTDVTRDLLFIFQSHLLQRKDAVFFETEEGLIYFTDILTRFQGRVNFIFWDRKLPARRRALIREACQWVFNNLELERIWGAFPASNAPALNALRKSGFTYEGTFRQGWLDSKGFQDLIYYAILKKEM